MEFFLRPITEVEARAVSHWQYPQPYAAYNGNPASVPSLLDPRYAYHAALDGRGELVGYFCFGRDATVPAGRRLGLYGGDDLDVGLGMRPDLTGRGLGRAFVRAGVGFAEARYRPPALRLTVAAQNHRAVRVYAAVGFETVERFGAPGAEWMLMRRPVPTRRKGKRT